LDIIQILFGYYLDSLLPFVTFPRPMMQEANFMQVDKKNDPPTTESSPKTISSQDSSSSTSIRSLKPRNRWLLPLIVLACVALGISAWFTISRFASNNTASNAASTAAPKEEPKNTPKFVTALGRLEPAGEVVKISSPSALGSSRVIKLLVKEGDVVKQGQVLAILDSYDRSVAALMQAQSQAQESDRRLAQVRAGAKSGDIYAQESTLRAAIANVGAAEANVNRISAEVAIAEREFQRYESLFKEGAISQSALDGYALKLRTAQEQLRQAQQQLQQAQSQAQQAQGLLSSVAEVRPTDIQAAEAQLQTALVNIKRAEIDVELAQVRAMQNGQILKVYAKEGESVGVNGLFEFGNTQQMYAVAEVYETDIGKVQKGQKAVITSEAFEGEVTGVVEQISMRVAKNDVLGTDPAAKTDVRVVEVKIKLDNSSKVSRLTNLQVRVKIAL
jgi:HlyD family secretion protein